MGIGTMQPEQQPMAREFYENDPIFKRMQWEVRAAFEAGYTASGVDRGKSKLNKTKGAWFDHWIASKSRAFLVNNGIISGKDDFR
jgi:hypothetical protein